MLRGCTSQKFWYFGFETTIQANFCSLDFNESRQRAALAVAAAAQYHAGVAGAPAPRAGSFLASREFQRLTKAVDGALCSEDNSMVELGMDFGQPYHFKQHSTGMVFWR